MIWLLTYTRSSGDEVVLGTFFSATLARITKNCYLASSPFLSPDDLSISTYLAIGQAQQA